tara:strand:- start:84 stop:758 length:675 start_codon:yes stop_codon:yes gene_type:complete
MSLTPFIQFTAGTPALATEVNSNFGYVQDWVDNDSMPRSGSVAFTGVPSGPATDPPSADSLTRRQYVDDKTKSNTGFKMISGSGTPTLTNVSPYNVWHEVCVVSSGTAIPVNATNQTLYLTAFCDAELTLGTGPATFGLRVSFSVNGSTYGATQQTSANADGSTGADYRYAGISLTGFHSFVYTGTPQIMRAKLEIVQRESFSSVWTVASARCRLAISREVPFA